MDEEMRRSSSRTTASQGDIISLREYVDMRFEAQEKAVSAALAAADRAVGKAEASTERRLEGMNEFRDALGDYSRTLMPRAEAEKSFSVQEQQMHAVLARINARDDRGGGRSDMLGWAVAVIIAIIAVIGFLLKFGA